MRRWPVWRRFIGWSQLFGGALGYLLLVTTVLQQRRGLISSLGPMPASWFVTSAIAFAVAIVAGILLLRQHRNGIALSTAVQVAQIVKIAVPGVATYQFSSGLNLLITITPVGMGIEPGVAASFAAFPTSNAPYWFISVNVLAALAAFVLFRQSRHDTDTGSRAAVDDESSVVGSSLRP